MNVRLALLTLYLDVTFTLDPVSVDAQTWEICMKVYLRHFYRVYVGRVNVMLNFISHYDVCYTSYETASDTDCINASDKYCSH